MSAREIGTPTPGIYFGMPDDEYHAIPALSQSGIKDLLVDPFVYWAGSHLNPLRVRRESAALTLGTATHKLILEGREAFDRYFAVKPDPSRFPGLLRGVEALRARCAELGEKKSGTLAEMAARIREAGDVTTPLWPEIEAAFEAESAGKVVLSAEQHASVRLALMAIEGMPSVRNAFRGGRSEVVIVFDYGGVRMKMRADYMRTSDDGNEALIFDLKTFGNQMAKPIEQAIGAEVARNRYFIQPPVYVAGLAAIRALYAERGDAVVHGDVDRDWLARLLARADRIRFYFVFQQTGTPIVLAREWGQRDEAYWSLGSNTLHKGLALYRHCAASFKPGEPWLIDRGVKRFDEANLPAWMYAEEPEGAKDAPADDPPPADDTMTEIAA